MLDANCQMQQPEGHSELVKACHFATRQIKAVKRETNSACLVAKKLASAAGWLMPAWLLTAMLIEVGCMHFLLETQTW